MLLDASYYANGEFEQQNPNKYVNTNKMDTVTDLLHIFFVGKAVESAEEQAVFVNNFAAYFRREPHLLQCILRDTIEADPRMRKVFFSALVDNGRVQDALLKQSVALKYGGKIPDSRWKLQFSPILQYTVQCKLYSQ